MATLLSISPTTASSGASDWAQFRDGIPESISLLGTATWNTTAGKTVDLWVQTKFSDGTPIDICEFHFATASSAAAPATRKVKTLSSLTVLSTDVTPTDGTMGASSAADGMLGSQYRVIWASTGTYDGVTSFQVDTNHLLVTLSSTIASI